MMIMFYTNRSNRCNVFNMVQQLSPDTIKIKVVAAVHPSEDSTKVETAIRNVFDGPTSHQHFSVVSNTSDASSLEPIREAIRTGAESRKAYRRNLEENLHKDTTWFYLNKQAAFAGRIAICQEADESPLGPIKIIITSVNPMQFMDWFLSMSLSDIK